MDRYFNTIPREVRARVLGYVRRPDLETYSGLVEDAYGDVEFLTSRIPVTTTHATEELLEDFEFLAGGRDPRVGGLFSTLVRMFNQGVLLVTGRRVNGTWLFPYSVRGRLENVSFPGFVGDDILVCDVAAPQTFVASITYLRSMINSATEFRSTEGVVVATTRFPV